MPLNEELPEGVEEQNTSQAIHTAHEARTQSEQASEKRSVNHKAMETFRTTWVGSTLSSEQRKSILAGSHWYWTILDF